MRQLRFGSYSIDATVAGTPSLFRLKSTRRYCCLWPPPRWRAVLRPSELRPPVFGLATSRVRSGRFLVISEKSDDVWKRRPGLVGLRERIPTADSAFEQRDRTRGERDDGVLHGRLGADAVGAARAALLALAVERVDLEDLHTPDGLDCVADLWLARRWVHLEGVDAALDQCVALLGDDRSEDDVTGVFHDCDSCLLLAASKVASDDLVNTT